MRGAGGGVPKNLMEPERTATEELSSELTLSPKPTPVPILIKNYDSGAVLNE